MDEGVKYGEGMGQAQSHSQHLPYPPLVLTPPHFFTPYPTHTLTPSPPPFPTPYTSPHLRSPCLIAPHPKVVGLGEGREQAMPGMVARMECGRLSVGMGCGCALEWGEGG
jgi:hypothetical protein